MQWQICSCRFLGISFLCTLLLKKMRPGLWEVLYTQELQGKWITVLRSGSAREKETRRNSKVWRLCTMMAPTVPKLLGTRKFMLKSISVRAGTGTAAQFTTFNSELRTPSPVSARTQKYFPGRHYCLLCSRFSKLIATQLRFFGNYLEIPSSPMQCRFKELLFLQISSCRSLDYSQKCSSSSWVIGDELQLTGMYRTVTNELQTDFATQDVIQSVSFIPTHVRPFDRLQPLTQFQNTPHIGTGDGWIFSLSFRSTTIVTCFVRGKNPTHETLHSVLQPREPCLLLTALRICECHNILLNHQ